jgi:hypothetical protein
MAIKFPFDFGAQAYTRVLGDGSTCLSPSHVSQVRGAISEFEKAMTVAKLRGARERKRRGGGQV